MNHVAAAFGYPFRKGSLRSWITGLLLVALFPLGALPLLGYCVSAVRASVRDPAAAPPAWGQPRRLLREGSLVALLLTALSLPFGVAAGALGSWVGRHLGGLPGTSDPAIAGLAGLVLAAGLLGLPWGILLLVVMPAATARYAAGGRASDLFDLVAALRLTGRRFPTWNLVAVTVVTAWAAGLAGLGVLGLGIVPGVYFALLASSHATAALAD